MCLQLEKRSCSVFIFSINEDIIPKRSIEQYILLFLAFVEIESYFFTKRFIWNSSIIPILSEKRLFTNYYVEYNLTKKSCLARFPSYLVVQL